MIAAAFAFAETTLAGQFTDAGGVAAGLAAYVSPLAGALFAVFLLDAAIIGAVPVTLSTPYAFGDYWWSKRSNWPSVRLEGSARSIILKTG